MTVKHFYAFRFFLYKFWCSQAGGGGEKGRKEARKEGERGEEEGKKERRVGGEAVYKVSVSEAVQGIA